MSGLDVHGGEPVTTLEGTPYLHRMVIQEFPTQTHVENWIKDPDYQKAMTHRHASSTMERLLVQEGGVNTQDPKL